MDKENIEQKLREKSDNYVVCYNEGCSLHEHCLHWLVGRYADEHVRLLNCINPRYASAAAGQCADYRDDRPILMPLGMKDFYTDIPQAKALKIKHRLIGDLGRTIYYRYHCGRRPIVPSVLAHIEKVCREEGWTEPLHFDDEVKELVW